MRQLFFILGLSILFFVACKKETNTISVRGLYTETNPVAGRSQLNFISSTLVIKTEMGSNFKDTFNYSFSANKIILTPTWDTQSEGQQFDFEKIDERTFKIENIYPGIPELEKNYMIFKK